MLPANRGGFSEVVVREAFPYSPLVTASQAARPIIYPLMAPAQAAVPEHLFQVKQKKIGGTAEPIIIPIKTYTQPRSRPISFKMIAIIPDQIP